MTLIGWLLVGLLLISAAAGYLLGNKMWREARGISNKSSGSASEDANAAPPSTAVDIVKHDIPPADIAGMRTAVAAKGAGSVRIRERLGVPAILEQVYSALEMLPDVDWSVPVDPISIEDFDDWEQLMEICNELPLIAMPIYAFFNAEGVEHGNLKIVGPSFFGGEIGHSPFLVIEAGDPNEEPRVLNDPATLNGKVISVLGRFMSPTIVLLKTLKAVGLSPEVWGANTWRNRKESPERVDILVNKTFESQVHDIEVGHTDYALIVYPFTHERKIAHSGSSGVCHVDFGPVAVMMREALSTRLLNVLVTRKDRYVADPMWRQRVDKLHAEVKRLNWQMVQLSQPGAAREVAEMTDLDDSFFSQEVYESQELDFETAVRAEIKPELLLELAEAGSTAGIIPYFDTVSAQSWVEEAA